MAEVGRLIESVLSVKHKGKWKRRLCILEKLATFTNSLKISVFDQEKSVCCIEDVVHAFISFLEPNRQGTLMLVCNYRVRCISFDHFEELNRWVGVLKTYLTCNYFHADLLLASKESKLARHAKCRRRHQLNLWSSKRSMYNTPGPNNVKLFRSLLNTSDDGYLHVTRDRIFFTTGPGCAHPRLLATWSFDNDELVQCGTARVKSDDNDSEQSDVLDRASLFFLTASPYHPDAPGCHLFLSDRATELCEWIENNNQSAIYQAEWRRLTSIAAVLDTPFASGSTSSSLMNTMPEQNLPDVHHVHATPLDLIHTTRLGRSQPSTQCCQCSLVSEYYSLERMEREEADDSSINPVCDGTVTEEPNPHLQHQLSDLSHQLDNPGSMESSSLSEQSFRPETSVQSNLEPIMPSTSGALPKRWVRMETPSDMTDAGTKSPCGPFFAQAEFEKRKLMAMHSRRRFSSHPVDTCVRGSSAMTSITQMPPFATSPLGSSLCCTHKAGALPSQVSWVDAHHSLAGSQWRQSEPQLVTISPIPMSLQELREFLRRPQATSCTSQPLSDRTSQSHLSKPTTADSVSKPTTDPSTREPKHRTTSGQILLSECSTSSVTDSAASELQSPYCTCSQCNLPLGAGEDCASPLTSADHLWPCTPDALSPGSTTNRPVVRRRRLPSSWSNTAGASHSLPEPGGCQPMWIQPRSVSGCAHPPPSLDRSLSSGNSPHYTFTPLLPTSTIIPGSHYFPPRRHHTTSASESFPSSHTGGGLICSTDPCPSASGGVLTTSAKASLVSLSPSAVPLWADAPVHAKPRTGSNYVSRDALLAWHKQKKRLQQQQRNHSPSSGDNPFDKPPPPSGVYSTTTCSTPMPPNTTVGPSFVQLHPCTPVPEALRESDDTTSPRAVEQSNTEQQALASTNSLTHTISTDAHLRSCSSDLTGSSGQMPSADHLLGPGPDPKLARSYINVAPPSRRLCLQPIAERQAMRSALTQPISRRHCLDLGGPNPVVMPVGSCSVGTLCSYVNMNELCKTALSSSATASSPVDVGSVAGSSSAVSTAAQCYINLAPSQVTSSSSTRGRGLRSILPGPEEPVLTTADCMPLEVGATCATAAPGCSSPPSALCLTSVPSTTGDSQGGGGSARLHYAHLTLSTNPANRGSNSTGPWSTLSATSPTGDHPPGHLHGIHSVPNTFSPNIYPAPITSDGEPKPTSGVNYVTIDLIQTKALSEVEQELRSSAAVETVVHHRSIPNKPRGFMTNLRRGFTSPGTSASTASEELRTGPRSERSSNQPVASSLARRLTASDVGTHSIHSRIFTCLAQSLTGSNRKQIYGRQRPSDNSPTTVSASTSNAVSPMSGPNIIHK